MKGLDHASHLKSLAQELIELAEKRAVLKAELAVAKKTKKTLSGGFSSEVPD